MNKELRKVRIKKATRVKKYREIFPSRQSFESWAIFKLYVSEGKSNVVRIVWVFFVKKRKDSYSLHNTVHTQK